MILVQKSTETITTEISPSLWKIYYVILNGLLAVKNKGDLLMQNILFATNGMKQHPYLKGKRGKTSEQRIAMEQGQKDKYKNREEKHQKIRKKIKLKAKILLIWLRKQTMKYPMYYTYRAVTYGFITEYTFFVEIDKKIIQQYLYMQVRYQQI